jgi:hypothetical protein
MVVKAFFSKSIFWKKTVITLPKPLMELWRELGNQFWKCRHGCRFVQHNYSLPLLVPSAFRNIVNSSIVPNGENITLTSSSLAAFDIIPINSFLSSEIIQTETSKLTYIVLYELRAEWTFSLSKCPIYQNRHCSTCCKKKINWRNKFKLTVMKITTCNSNHNSCAQMTLIK